MILYTHVHATAVSQPNCTHVRSASGMKQYIIVYIGWSTVDLVTLHLSQLSDKGLWFDISKNVGQQKKNSDLHIIKERIMVTFYIVQYNNIVINTSFLYFINIPEYWYLLFPFWMWKFIRMGLHWFSTVYFNSYFES